MSKALRYYLAAYNFIAFVFWLSFLLAFIVSGFRGSVYGFWLLNIAQGLAVLEILHASLKWVKSPVLSTIAQIASRILVVAWIDLFLLRWFLPLSFMDAGSHALMNTGILIVSLAWSITEIIRYSFYGLSLFNKQPRWLLWMRYSFFIALYPLGVTGEWLIFISPYRVFGISVAYTVLIILLFASYAYYFPVLYKYMWTQRRLKAGMMA